MEWEIPLPGLKKTQAWPDGHFWYMGTLNGFSFFETPKGQFENEIGQLKKIHFIGDAKVMWKI